MGEHIARKAVSKSPRRAGQQAEECEGSPLKQRLKVTPAIHNADDADGPTFVID